MHALCTPLSSVDNQPKISKISTYTRCNKVSALLVLAYTHVSIAVKPAAGFPLNLLLFSVWTRTTGTGGARRAR